MSAARDSWLPASRPRPPVHTPVMRVCVGGGVSWADAHGCDGQMNVQRPSNHNRLLNHDTGSCSGLPCLRTISSFQLWPNSATASLASRSTCKQTDRRTSGAASSTPTDPPTTRAMPPNADPSAAPARRQLPLAQSHTPASVCHARGKGGRVQRTHEDGRCVYAANEAGPLAQRRCQDLDKHQLQQQPRRILTPRTKDRVHVAEALPSSATRFSS
jgi:hypothetical protein